MDAFFQKNWLVGVCVSHGAEVKYVVFDCGISWSYSYLCLFLLIS